MAKSSNSAYRIVYLTLMFGGSLGTNVFQESAKLNLVWSDEFDDPLQTQPDLNVWAYDLGGGGWGNGELQTYTADPLNIRVENGYLEITAIPDSDLDFTSARITTQDRLEFQYGILEANISVPDTVSGVWPAFWIMGRNFPRAGWPACGEVDIMEVGWKGKDNRRIFSAAHWEHNDTYALYDGYFDYPRDLDQGFHIFRLEWTDKYLATFVDEYEMWRMDISQPSPCTDCSEFHQPYFVLLNVAVGGGFTTDADCGGSSAAGSSGGCIFRPESAVTAPFPAEMKVDWIRLYNNGLTVLNSPQPTEPPVPLVTPAVPTAPVQPEPAPTPQPTRRPTRPPTFSATMQPTDIQPVSPSPLEPVLPQSATQEPVPPSPTIAPTMAGEREPVPRNPTSSASSSSRSGKGSGKGGSGKGGKGGGSSKSGKGGKGKSKSSTNYSSLTSKEAVSSSISPPSLSFIVSAAIAMLVGKLSI